MTSSADVAALQRVHDRVTATSNDELPRVLDKLLPGLLPLCNKDDLRPQVLTIVTNISRRVKSLGISLPCAVLIDRIVRRDMLPYACNIAISLIDLSIDKVPISGREDCACAILRALDSFVVDNGGEYSNQAAALLNYTLRMLPEVINQMTSPSIVSSQWVKDAVLGWLLDVSLVLPGLRRDAVGSIQPGLSQERVRRLTAKREVWPLPEISPLKLSLLSAVFAPGLQGKYAAAICSVLVCDPDPVVAQEANFKLSGLRSAILRSGGNIQEASGFLLKICGLGYEDTCERGLAYRIPLKEEVRVQALQWALREALPTLHDVTNLVHRVYSKRGDFPGPLAGVQAGARLQGSLLTLTEAVLRETHILEERDIYILMQGCTAALQRFLGGENAFSVDDVDTTVRNKAYAIMDSLSRRYPKALVSEEYGMDAVLTLFKLIEKETESGLSRLLSALGGIRQAYQEHRPQGIVTPYSADKLEAVILSARNSSVAKKRLVGLQWARAMYGWSRRAIEALVVVAGDPSDIVHAAALTEFIKLRTHVQSIGDKDTSEELKSLISSLLSVRDSSADSQDKRYLATRREVFLTVFHILEKALPEGDVGCAPFIGAAQWPMIALRFRRSETFQDCVIPPSLVVRVLDTVSSEREVSGQCANPEQVLLVEGMVKLTRNSLLLGAGECTAKGRSMLASLLQWMEVVSEPSQQYLAQSIGLLCMSPTPGFFSQDDMNFVAKVWRILLLKVQSGSSTNQVTSSSIKCLTAVVETLVCEYSMTRSEGANSSSSLRVVQMCSELFDVLLPMAIPLVGDELSAQPHKLRQVALDALGDLVGRGLLSTNIPTCAVEGHCDPVIAQEFTMSDKKTPMQLILLEGLRTTITCASLTGEGIEGEVSVAASAVRSLSKLCAAGAMDRDDFFDVWHFLLDMKLVKDTHSVMFRFELAEAVVRMAMADSFDTSLLIQLLERMEVVVLSVGRTERERSFAAVVLLVALKQSKELHRPNLLQRMAVAFLLVIRGPQQHLDGNTPASTQEPFAQDVCCAGLCRLYDIASSISLEKEGEKDDKGTDKSYAQAAERISSLVISTLCREKKGIAIAGVAVAGESTSSGAAGDMAEEAERILEGGTVPIPAGGTGEDLLAAAAASAAAELNIFSSLSVGGELGERRNNSARGEDSYGVYTKICKVAKKAGDPSVVFGVLSLVRRDPAFGSHGSDTEKYFNKYKSPVIKLDRERIRRLLPMLYMTRFDPTPSIRDLMRTLWSTLVPTEQESSLLSSQCEEILKYLASNLTSRQWRERESACLALEVYIPQRPWRKIRPCIAQLWDLGMRVLDDVRDTTRIAALGFMKVLSNQVVTACNPEVNEDSVSINPANRESTLDDATAFIIPILLDKGLLAPSPEGRGFSMGLLLRIVKVTKSSLKDHLIRLISVLVESMSAMEPRTLEYMSFHTERLNISNEDLESTRLRLSQLSPLQDALDACLESLRAPTTTGIVPEIALNLSMQTQQGVGLATRVAAVRSLVHIVSSYPESLKRVTTEKCFRIILSSLLPTPPSSSSLTREMLSAVGVLSKVTSPEFLVEIIRKLVDMYDKADNADTHMVAVVGECIHQIIAKAGDALQEESEMWRWVLCSSYLGSFIEDDDTRAPWEKLFADATVQSTHGTREAALRAVLTDVLKGIESLLGSLSWTQRTQALAATKDLISIFPSGLLAPNMTGILVGMLKTLPGQMWRGKEAVLRTLSALLSHCPQCVDTSANVSDLVAATLVSRSSSFVLIHLGDMESRVRLNDTITQRVQEWEGTTASVPLKEDSKSILPACKSWRVSWSGVLTLLLQESERGERQYRLAAATAMSTLPWQIAQTISGVKATVPLLPRIWHAAGIPSSITGIETEPPIAISKAVDDEGKSRPAPVRAAVDMFGGRYGDEFSVNSKSKRAKLSSPALPTVTIASVATSHDTSTSRTEETIISAVEDISEPNAEENGDTTSSSQQPSEIVVSKADAAVRVKFLEASARGWPSSPSLCVECDGSSETLAATVSKLVKWVCGVIHHEIWSVRRAAIVLLESLASWSLLSNDLQTYLDIVGFATNDSRYHQIRVAALSALCRLFDNTGAGDGRVEFFKQAAVSVRVSAVLAAAAIDSNPSVLSAHANASRAWQALTTNK